MGSSFGLVLKALMNEQAKKKAPRISPGGLAGIVEKIYDRDITSNRLPFRGLGIANSIDIQKIFS